MESAWCPKSPPSVASTTLIGWCTWCQRLLRQVRCSAGSATRGAGVFSRFRPRFRPGQVFRVRCSAGCACSACSGPGVQPVFRMFRVFSRFDKGYCKGRRLRCAVQAVRVVFRVFRQCSGTKPICVTSFMKLIYGNKESPQKTETEREPTKSQHAHNHTHTHTQK